ncbi:MAG: hypothetical protein AB8G95_25420 [Anaerolineae bacterium]
MKNNSNLEMKYMIAFPIFLLACCAVMFWATLIAGPSASTITGVVLTIASILMLTRPIVVMTPNSVEWRNLIGRTAKTVSYKPDSIEVKENRVFIDGHKQLNMWMFNINADTVSKYLEENRSA